MLSATLILAIALVAIYVVRSVRTYSALNDFGGHWSTGWSRLWLLRTQGSGEMNKRFTTINNRYGESPYHFVGSRICHIPSDTPIGCHQRRLLRTTPFTQSRPVSLGLDSFIGMPRTSMLTGSQARQLALGRRCSSPATRSSSVA